MCLFGAHGVEVAWVWTSVNPAGGTKSAIVINIQKVRDISLFTFWVFLFICSLSGAFCDFCFEQPHYRVFVIWQNLTDTGVVLADTGWKGKWKPISSGSVGTGLQKAAAKRGSSQVVDLTSFLPVLYLICYQRFLVEKKLPLYQLGCSEEVELLGRSSAWEVILTGFKGRITLQADMRLNPGSAFLHGLCGRAQVI